MKTFTFGIAGMLIAFTSSLTADPFDTFHVQSIKGTCKIKAEGASAWDAVQEKAAYKAGSSGKTERASAMTVAFDPQNTFRLLPETEVIIRTSTHAAKFRKIDLEIAHAGKNGGVHVTENLPEGYKLEVQTPTAVCGTVGTEFEVKIEDNQKKNF